MPDRTIIPSILPENPKEPVIDDMPETAIIRQKREVIDFVRSNARYEWISELSVKCISCSSRVTLAQVFWDDVEDHERRHMLRRTHG